MANHTLLTDFTSNAMERAEADAVATTTMVRDLSSGGGGAFRPSTLLDEYERLAIEAQLDRAVLRRSYSEPSPSRLATAPQYAQPRDFAAAAAAATGRREPARRSWLVEALKRLFCWLGFGGAWAGRAGRREERAVPCPPASPAPPPRVQLLDYLSASTAR
uniref:Uncharacterized protein n=1 Tax=Leersia perrieri TaxID=77586 RepID=A0A0D9V788_9ORYZ